MECSFCNKKIRKGKGKTIVDKSGKSFFYCSSKCEKNHQKLGRDPKHIKWVKQK